MATLFKSSKETLDSLPLQVLEGHFLLVDSAVALFAECVIYSESLLVSAIILLK